jgi:hypothetical protein
MLFIVLFSHVLCEVVVSYDNNNEAQQVVRPIEGVIEDGDDSVVGEEIVAPRRDPKQFSGIALAAREIGEESSVIIEDAKLMAKFIGALAITFLIALLAGTFVGTILILFGVSKPRISGAVLGTIAFISIIGLAFSLRLLNIEFGQILIGLGILSYGASRIFGDLAANMVNGFVVRVSPQYQPGMEITPMMRTFGFNGPRGVIHALELTTLLVDMSSPLIMVPSPGQKIRPEDEIVTTTATGLPPETSVTQDLLHISYTDFINEPHMTNVYNKRYAAYLRDLTQSRYKRRANMGVTIVNPAEKRV